MKDGLPVHRIGLYWQAKVLRDEITVGEFGIQKEDTLHVYLRWPHANSY